MASFGHCVLIFFILISSILISSGMAGQEVALPVAPQVQTKGRPPARSKQAKKRKGFRGEKEAEGTEAADRFESNTVIKSKYQLSGEALEVDPD